ncbi:MAG: D-isomer specific 2-hydroxyacid dehydrogenase family protein [Acutalibacteraceae bacterium]|nr:lactate dehydrogenase [Bacillota bacterium]
MKLTVFEVRDDEKGFLQQAAKRVGVTLALSDQSLTDQTLSLIQGSEGVSILGDSRMDEKLLAKLKDKGVKALSTRTIGFNHIDLAAAHRVGVRVAHASYPPNGVADFTVMLMLLTLRNYKPAMWRQNVNDYSLMGLRGRELRSLTVGVMGTGSIGRTVLQNLSGFGCRLLAYDKYQDARVAGLARYVPLETLLRESDVISLHMPLTPETDHIIDRKALDKMKDGVVLINTARGALTDIYALTEGIETGKIGALGMDVLENEEGIYHNDLRTDIIKNRDMVYLRQFPNVVLTQHMAFYTEESVRSMADCGVETLFQMLSGEKCPLEL